MKQRVHLRNDTSMIEWTDTPQGLKAAKAFRKNNPEFKYRRIRRVLQMFPQEVKRGRVYELTIGR